MAEDRRAGDRARGHRDPAGGNRSVGGGGRRAHDRALSFCVIYLSSLGFWVPVFVFGSPYAAVGGMTIAHGLQYLFLVGMVAAADGQRPGRTLRLAAFCNVALAGGAVLGTASHLHGAAPAARLVFGAYLGAVMAHFVIDAGLWRLRDPFPRAFLASRVPSLVARRTRPTSRNACPVDDGSSADLEWWS